jgi:hypothetical protein
LASTLAAGGRIEVTAVGWHPHTVGETEHATGSARSGDSWWGAEMVSVCGEDTAAWRLAIELLDDAVEPECVLELVRAALE